MAREAFDEDLASVGSSLNAYIILKHVDFYPGLSQRQLAAILGIEGPTSPTTSTGSPPTACSAGSATPTTAGPTASSSPPEGRPTCERVTDLRRPVDAEFRKLFTERS